MDLYLEHLTKCKPDTIAIVSDILTRCRLHKPSIIERLFRYRKFEIVCWRHRKCITSYVYRTLDNKPIPFDIIHEYSTPSSITIEEIERAFEGIEDITFEWDNPYYGFNKFKCTLYISFNLKGNKK